MIGPLGSSSTISGASPSTMTTTIVTGTPSIGPDTFAGTVSGPSPHVTAGGSGPLGTVGWTPTAYGLPAKVGLGVATIHRYDDNRVLPSTIAISVFTPVPSAAFPSVVLDLNAKTFDQIIPDQAIIGDAGLTRAFLGVDKREGTPLDTKLDAIVAKIPKKADGSIDAETAIQYVRVQVGQLIAWTAGSSANDGHAEFPWDKAIKIPQSVWETFSSVAYAPVGNSPVQTGFEFPVVPLEKYLEAGEGYCIQKALLASLILEKCGVKHRLVNGAVSQKPGKSVGHTWIELADGRVLDAAWKTVAMPEKNGAPVPGFFKVGGSWRFENQTFPYLRCA